MFLFLAESCRFVDKRRKRSEEAGKFGREIEAAPWNQIDKEKKEAKKKEWIGKTRCGKIYFFQRSRFAISSNFFQRDQSGASIEI